jgi:hypothetical protein
MIKIDIFNYSSLNSFPPVARMFVKFQEAQLGIKLREQKAMNIQTIHFLSILYPVCFRVEQFPFLTGYIGFYSA